MDPTTFSLHDPDDALEILHSLRIAWPEATAAALIGTPDGTATSTIPFLGEWSTGADLVMLADICAALLRPGPACLVLWSLSWPPPAGVGMNQPPPAGVGLNQPPPAGVGLNQPPPEGVGMNQPSPAAGIIWDQIVQVWVQMELRCRSRGISLLDWLMLDGDAAASLAELHGQMVRSDAFSWDSSIRLGQLRRIKVTQEQAFRAYHSSCSIDPPAMRHHGGSNDRRNQASGHRP